MLIYLFNSLNYLLIIHPLSLVYTFDYLFAYWHSRCSAELLLSLFDNLLHHGRLVDEHPLVLVYLAAAGSRLHELHAWIIVAGRRSDTCLCFLVSRGDSDLAGVVAEGLHYGVGAR